MSRAASWKSRAEVCMRNKRTNASRVFRDFGGKRQFVWKVYHMFKVKMTGMKSVDVTPTVKSVDVSLTVGSVDVTPGMKGVDVTSTITMNKTWIHNLCEIW